jgi:hypothetical protein
MTTNVESTNELTNKDYETKIALICYEFNLPQPVYDREIITCDQLKTTYKNLFIQAKEI